LYDDLLVKAPWALRYGITIFHVNPPEVESNMALEWQLMPIEKCMNVAVPFWELPTLPETWRRILSSMDVVLAPTRYILTTIESELPDVRVLHYPQAVAAPAGAVSSRERFGIPPERTVFLSAFDMASDIHRKNPWSAVEAFERAFDRNDPVMLIVKVNNVGLWPQSAPLRKRLYAVASSNPNITIIDRAMSYSEVMCLYASCDVFVSLHRAEGLGLILMEMMSLGKPVIATAWSGNMDFMTERNSCLVGYEMVPIEASYSAYHQESLRAAGQWADANIDEAAAFMRRCADKPAYRERLGKEAAADMRKRCRSVERVETFVRLKEIYDTGEYLIGHAERSAGLSACRRLWLRVLRERIVRTAVSPAISVAKRILRPLAPALRPLWRRMKRSRQHS